MDITGYQAATVEMEKKAKRAWLALKGHVVKKEMREKMAQTPTTETGNSVHGRVMTTVTLLFSRYGMHYFQGKWRKILYHSRDGQEPICG